MAIPFETTGAANDRPVTPAAVRLESVEKRYGDVLAVAGVDLDVRDGEFFSMLGPSGSGNQRPNQLPLVNVAAVLVLVLSIIPVYFASRLTADPATVAGART